MNTSAIVLERTFAVGPISVWKALTEIEEIKHWYYPLNDFKAEVGFKFQFWAGEKDKNHYLHVCKVLEVLPNKKLSYSWKYDDHEGDSTVTFELYPLNEKTTLRLTHSGLTNFEAQNIRSKQKISEAWTYFINTSLKEYLEPDASADYIYQFTINTTDASIYKALTTQLNCWWSKSVEGTAQQREDVFTVHFGGSYKTFSVQEAIPNETVQWFCTDSHIDADTLSLKNEWNGTSIRWNIHQEGNQSKVTLIHLGLTSALECYETCIKGWQSFTDSLSKFLLTGEGTPFKK